MTSLVDRLPGLAGALVLVIAGLVVFAEDALLAGFVISGETVAVLAGSAVFPASGSGRLDSVQPKSISLAVRSRGPRPWIAALHQDHAR